MPGLTEASDRRDPLVGDSRPISKHCAMDTGSEAGMTKFLGLFSCFGDPIQIIEFATFLDNDTSEIYPGQ